MCVLVLKFDVIVDSLLLRVLSQVAVREETRQVESEPYGELKTLYEEAVHRLEQVSSIEVQRSNA